MTDILHKSMLILTTHPRFPWPIHKLIPKLILLKLTRYLRTVHCTLFWRTLRILCLPSAMILLIGDMISLVIKFKGDWLLDYGEADVFRLEFVETGGMGRFKDVLLDGAAIGTTVHAFVMHSAGSLPLIINPTLEQHLHPGNLPNITFHSWCLRPFNSWWMRPFRRCFMGFLPLHKKGVLHKDFSFTNNGLIELTEVDGGFIEGTNGLNGFHFMTEKRGATIGRVEFVGVWWHELRCKMNIIEW